MKYHFKKKILVSIIIEAFKKTIDNMTPFIIDQKIG